MVCFIIGDSIGNNKCCTNVLIYSQQNLTCIFEPCHQNNDACFLNVWNWNFSTVSISKMGIKKQNKWNRSDLCYPFPFFFYCASFLPSFSLSRLFANPPPLLRVFGVVFFLFFSHCSLRLSSSPHLCLPLAIVHASSSLASTFMLLHLQVSEEDHFLIFFLFNIILSTTFYPPSWLCTYMF